jgi:uncharacterized protein YoaH (UPF0181 family)
MYRVETGRHDPNDNLSLRVSAEAQQPAIEQISAEAQQPAIEQIDILRKMNTGQSID